MTEVNLNSIFSSLETSAYDLNNASDQANQTLVNAEARLIDLNVGIEVWHPTALAITDSTGGSGPYETSEDIIDVFGFARVEGKWCLAVKRIKRVSGFYQGDTDCPYTNEFLELPPAPLLNQSRSHRINAVAALPEFIEYVSDQVRAKNLQLSQAMDRLSG